MLLENQLQAAVRGHQYLMEQLIRDSVYQVESWAKQAQASQAVQATAVNAFAAKGLNDVSSPRPAMPMNFSLGDATKWNWIYCTDGKHGLNGIKFCELS